jgi:hypothetical protein
MLSYFWCKLLQIKLVFKSKYLVLEIFLLVFDSQLIFMDIYQIVGRDMFTLCLSEISI